MDASRKYGSIKMGTYAWMYVCTLWYEECRLRMVEMRERLVLSAVLALGPAGTDWRPRLPAWLVSLSTDLLLYMVVSSSTCTVL